MPDVNYDEQRQQRQYELYRQEMESRRNRGYYGSEGQTGPDTLSFADWSAQPLAQQFSTEFSGGNRFGETALDENDPLVAQFIQQFGSRDYNTEAPDSGNARATGYSMGYGDPSYMGSQDFMQDGSRVIRLPDGRYIRETGNIDNAAIAGTQDRDASEFGPRYDWLAAVLGAAAAGGAFGGEGLFGGAPPGGESFLPPGGPSGTAAFGSPGFGAGEWAGILPEAGSTPAMFGTPGFGGGEMFFTDTMGLGGGGGALGTGTSLVGTGLGAGTVTGPLGSGFSLAGTGLAPGAVTGTGAVAGGAAAGGSMVRDALSLARDLLGGGEGEGAGGGILGGFGAAPKIGEHRQDNDPYGLMASGYGPWTGLIPESSDSKKAKITEAMMKRNPTSTWG